MDKQRRLVVKDNALINASYNLDVVEQRLILLAIIEARKTSTPINDLLTVHADKYMESFGVTKQTAYEGLQDACLSLFERRFSYEKLTSKGNVEKVLSRWVQRVSYVNSEALVRIKFSEDVIPLIKNLEQRFTSYDLEQVSLLTSAYAIRLYELLIAWRSTGKTPVFALDDFRSKLGLEPNEYQKMSNFKIRVLDMAVEQINRHTDINVKVEQRKTGRRITGFGFNFQFKKPQPVKSKRKPLTKEEAANKALPGELWPDLIKRLSPEYIVIM